MNEFYAPEELKQKNHHRRRHILIPILLSICLLATLCSILWFTGAFKAIFTMGENIDAPVTDYISGDIDFDGIVNADTPKSVPEKFHGAAITAGIDYYKSGDTIETAKSQIAEKIKYLSQNNYKTLYVDVNFEDGIIFSAEGAENKFSEDLLAYISGIANQNGMTVVSSIDIGRLAKNSIIDHADISAIEKIITSESFMKNSQAVLLRGYGLDKSKLSYFEYCSQSGGIGYEQYCLSTVTSSMKQFASSINRADSSMYTGILCDSVWSVLKGGNGGIAVPDGTTASRENSSADTLSWLKNDIFDFSVVVNDRSTSDNDCNFETVMNWWISAVDGKADISFMLSSDKIGSQAPGWSNPDQLVKQLMMLNKTGSCGFIFNSTSAIMNDSTGSTSAISKYFEGAITDDYILKELSFTTPAKTDFTINEPYVNFIGASDPQFEATLNGEPLERNEIGYFSLRFDNLKLGINTYTFVHKGKTVTFNVNYKKVIIKAIAPKGSLKLDGGVPFGVSVEALRGSTVTATLNGVTITLTSPNDSEGEYTTYNGVFILPQGEIKAKNLGSIQFKVVSDFGTESRTGGSVTIKKADILDVPGIEGPSGGNYINVGTGFIAEVTSEQAETFDGNSTDDFSRPTNNYLPKGTVDYTHRSMVYDSDSKNYYRLIRSNRRLYSQKFDGTTNVKTYDGTLPDVNNIKVASTDDSGRFTSLAFNVDFKAPFLLDIAPQKYSNPGRQDYSVGALTYQYVDITFCYAASFEGEIKLSEGNPVFSRAEVIKNASDYTLRLYLKKMGAFYGWSANYNESGQLVFNFLNPVKISDADNAFGASLSGVRILIDAGHGGSDGGASGSNKNFPESKLTLMLANELKNNLESIGATVYMTRSDNSTVYSVDRISYMRQVKPDYAISIHRNAANNPRARGFISYYYHPYSVDPVKSVYNNFGLFGQSSWSGTNWHYFFLGRVSDCPVVLAECGFVSNTNDFSSMCDPTFNKQSADALTRGVVSYFKSIR